MNARAAATLIFLCGQALATPAGSNDPPPPLHVPVHSARTTTPPPSPPPAPSERALVLAGLALMAGIALRRMGDGAP
jgi:hypothetical protein